MESVFGQSKADRYMLIGILLSGLVVTLPIGLPMVFYGLHLESRRCREEKSKRPLALAALALWGILNGLVNLYACSTILFASDNWFVKKSFEYYGTMIDLRYWAYGFNTAAWPGPAERFEMDLYIVGMGLFFPMYTVANYGLFQLKKWGYTWAVISAWIGIFFTFFYVTDHTLAGNKNILEVSAPIWGWWIMNGAYLTPFFAVPYLQTMNREVFE